MSLVDTGNGDLPLDENLNNPSQNQNVAGMVVVECPEDNCTLGQAGARWRYEGSDAIAAVSCKSITKNTNRTPARTKARARRRC